MRIPQRQSRHSSRHYPPLIATLKLVAACAFDSSGREGDSCLYKNCREELVLYSLCVVVSSCVCISAQAAPFCVQIPDLVLLVDVQGTG